MKLGIGEEAINARLGGRESELVGAVSVILAAAWSDQQLTELLS